MPGIQYRHIIVAVDGSDSAGRAAAFAANLAYCCEAYLTLLYVQPKPRQEPTDPAAQGDTVKPQPAPAAEPAASDVFQRARDAMLLVRRALNQAGIVIEEQILQGDPAQVIVEYARHRPESMIVMGSRGLSRMRELLLGSVSSKVLRQAACPVTVVP